jgi:hypothetical protein
VVRVRGRQADLAYVRRVPSGQLGVRYVTPHREPVSVVGSQFGLEHVSQKQFNTANLPTTAPSVNTTPLGGCDGSPFGRVANATTAGATVRAKRRRIGGANRQAATQRRLSVNNAARLSVNNAHQVSVNNAHQVSVNNAHQVSVNNAHQVSYSN